MTDFPMVILGFIPLVGQVLGKPVNRNKFTRQCTQNSTQARTRQRVQIHAVTQIPGESVSRAVPNDTADEGPKQYIEITNVMETPGGWIVDASVTNFKKQTKHTVILGKKILEGLCEGLDKRPAPGTVIQFLFEFFMANRQNLTNTQGLLDVGAFPINYFSVRQVFYFFPEAKETLIAKIAESLSDC